MEVELGLPPRGEAPEEALRVGTHVVRSYRTAPDRDRIPRERLWIRAAAFGIDLLLFAGLPLLASTLLVFGVLLAAPDPPERIGGVFRGAQALFLFGFLLRDAGGGSPGKRMLGLRTLVRDGRSPVLASVARNLPLLVPGWNLVEALLVLRSEQRRPGDRLGGTAVVEG